MTTTEKKLPKIQLDKIPQILADRLGAAVYQATLKWVMEQEANKKKEA